MIKIQFEVERRDATTLMKLNEALKVCNEAEHCNEECKYYHLKKVNHHVCPVADIKIQLDNLIDN